MKMRQWLIGIVLVLLVAAAFAGLLLTREVPLPNEEGSAPSGNDKPGHAGAHRPLVDVRPLLTARRMAALASTHEEQALAHQALKIGDHEVDLAFFDALRTAEENPPKLSGEAKQIAERKNAKEQAV